MRAVDNLDRLLQLPPVAKSVEENKMNYAVKPDTSTLTDDQREIFDSFMEVVKQPEDAICILKGYAGTGKTYLTTMLMEEILSTMNVSVAVTAPTNKAVKVLKKQSKFSEQVVNLCFSTIHSLLGLREKIDGYGKQTFVRMREEDVKVGQYQIIIVDESSMLADELFDQLMSYTKVYNLKLIFIGDPAQIPPVNQGEFVLFTPEGEKKYEATVGSLTQVLRQSLDNPIISMTMKIRNAIGRDVAIPIRNDAFDEETMDGVYFMTGDDKEAFYAILKRYFVSDNFKEDADFMKIVAYTNKTVRIFNTRVRKMIYGDERTKIMVGEKLIANKPIMDDNDSVLFSTNDEFEVVSYVINSGHFKGVEFNYYEAIVNSYSMGNRMIKIIHESSQEDYDLVLEHLLSEAKAVKQGTWDAAGKWKDFYAFQTIFADVNYNYAITAHKSQGSTYGNVVVIESDIDINRRIVERNRIKYTAFTRPKHKLFIVT